MSRIVVEPYNPNWPLWFAQICAPFEDQMRQTALCIEHVGSTAVPGLWAKPVIDIDIVVQVPKLPEVIQVLQEHRYKHRGTLGIQGRHAFRYQGELPLPRHNLYVCVEGADSLKNHLLLRDYLLTHEEAVQEYSTLKRRLAEKFPEDIDAYIDGKTPFITRVLAEQGMQEEVLREIREANEL